MIEYISAKTIVAKTPPTQSGWFSCEYNMNIYKGCSHGCIYCDSRSDCYRIENFDTVRAKRDALSIIESDLKRKRKKGIVALGAMSDPYNPFENQLGLTRGALSLIERYRFGASIFTKSPLVVRDIDILKGILEHSPVNVAVTITAIDDAMCKAIEPNVAVSSKRFDALKQLSDSGIMCGVLLMPILPFITDTSENIEGIVRAAKASGARYVFCYGGFGVTLRQNQRDYFYQRLDEKFLGLKQRYIKEFKDAYWCVSPNSNELYSKLGALCNQLGLEYEIDKINDLIQKGYQPQQLSFFD